MAAAAGAAGWNLRDVRLFDGGRSAEAGKPHARGVDFANQRPARRIHLEAASRRTTVTPVTKPPSVFLNYDIKAIW